MDEGSSSAPVAKNLTLEDTLKTLGDGCAYSSYKELVKQCGSIAKCALYVMSTGASDSSGMSAV